MSFVVEGALELIANKGLRIRVAFLARLRPAFNDGTSLRHPLECRRYSAEA